jgi:hypothetical protein
VLGHMLGALLVVVVALVVIVLALAATALGTAGLLLVGRLVGGAFGVGTLEAAALALAVAVGLGLALARVFAGPSSTALRDQDEDLVALGSDEPETPEYDEAGKVYCPNCEQRLDLSRSRSPKPRRP